MPVQVGLAYSHCCWQMLGKGQFFPNEQSNPSVGEAGTLTQVKEWRVEMMVAESCLTAVLTALDEYHPYETPAFHYWRVNERD